MAVIHYQMAIFAIVFIAEIVGSFTRLPAKRTGFLGVIYRRFWRLALPLGRHVIGPRAVKKPYQASVPLGFVVALFFTFFSVLEIFTPELLLVQLSVTWLAYALAATIVALLRRSLRLAELARAQARRSRREQKRKRALAEDLRLVTRDFERVSRERLRAVELGRVLRIPDERHREALLAAIEDATAYLCVVSPWMNTRALNASVLEKLQCAIDRGVKVFIGFGYESKGRRRALDLESQLALSALFGINEAGRDIGDGELKVGWLGTHEKIVVVDDVYGIVGSANWLSNSAFLNKELSLKVQDQEWARAERDRVSSEVRAHPIEQFFPSRRQLKASSRARPTKRAWPR